ncbi:hypothetical protein GX48_00707 [Paracoccidioides brasiliensis]|nr:hypothetical protein GX48_00707 [Paracoccidioides brasiliensis]
MTEDGKRHLSSESLVPIGFDTAVDFENPCSVELVEAMEDKWIRFTAVDDVGKFVARALDLKDWPDQFLVSGENISRMEPIELCEKVRGNPCKSERIFLEDLENKLGEVKKANNEIDVFKWSNLRLHVCWDGDFGWG